jgi:hypothetical protein
MLRQTHPSPVLRARKTNMPSPARGEGNAARCERSGCCASNAWIVQTATRLVSFQLCGGERASARCTEIFLRARFRPLSPRAVCEGSGAPSGAPWPRLAATASTPRKQVYAVCATRLRLRHGPPWRRRLASRRSTAVLATGPKGSPVAQLRAALPGTRTIWPSPSPASSSQTCRSAGRAEPRSRPSAGLRDLPAGAAPRSAFKTSPEDAPRRARRMGIQS